MLGRGAPSVLFMHSSSHRDCVGREVVGRGGLQEDVKGEGLVK